VGTHAPADTCCAGVRGGVRYADFDVEASLDKAFAGAETILIISTDLLDLANGQRLRQHKRAIDAARRTGAKHLAYTSMLAPEPSSPFLVANDHYGTEQAIKGQWPDVHHLSHQRLPREPLAFAAERPRTRALADGSWRRSRGDRDRHLRYRRLRGARLGGPESGRPVDVVFAYGRPRQPLRVVPGLVAAEPASPG
jgi:NAD(P)H dehydrogenase (quinone)